MSTPARNASVHKTGRNVRFAALFSRSTARSAILAACGAMLVAGCNQVGTGGLSSNLPPAGGGGVLSFVSVSMPDAVAGRAYSKVAVTSVETQSKTNFPISPAIASGTAPLASCTLTSGSLPPGMNAAITIDPTGSGCVISGTPSGADAGNTYQFTIQALDSNSPPRAAAQSFTMKVRPEFTVTAPAAVVGNALPAGVQGRSYGQIAGNAAAFTATTNLSATTGNGPVGAKNYCLLSVTPALPSLTMTQVVGTNNCMLQGSGTLAAAGSYKVSIALTDNPIVDPETNLQAVPANTIAGASNASLNVGTPLKIAAQSDGVSAMPPAAVQGRAYGTGSGCSGGACLPLTYVATGGLPSVETADAYLFTDSGLAAAGLNCTATAPSTVAKTTCGGTAGAPGTSNFSVTVDDAGNLATPGGSASGTTSTISGLSLTVDSTLSLAVSPDPATNPAVQNSAYGIGTGCTGPGGNCVAPTYTPSGGLGSYSFSVTGSTPAGIACTANGGNTAVVCSGTASATAATSTFGVSASDVANASTPSATSSPVSKMLTVNGALTLTPPTSLQPAVSGRAFGSGTGCSGGGGNCAPAVFMISGGLGTYAANATITSAPGTWTCPLSGSQYDCSSASVGSGSNLSITTSDGASATTPGQTTASASVPITVNQALVLTLPSTVNDAVTGRPYGTGSGCTGGSCVALQYALTGGLGAYGSPVLTAGPNTFTCTGTGTYSCSIATISGSGTQTLSMTIPDSSNVSTPTAAATDTSKSITIYAKVTLTNANLGATWPAAVQGRAYAGAGFLADQFTAANGIGAYTFLAPSGFPTGFNCVTAATTDTCSSASVGTSGSYSPQITVHDAGNASTPQSTVTTDPSSQFTASLSVKPTVTVTAPNLAALPAVAGRPFGSGSGCSSGNCQPAVFTVAGGLGTYAATANVVASPGTWTCTLSGTNYDCLSTSVTGYGANSLTIDVADVANSTTPAATTTTDTNSQSTATVTVDPQITLTAPAGLALAVNGRSYGVVTNTNCTGGGSGCVPAAFTVAGGLGSYPATATVLSAPGGVTATWTCALSTPHYNCSSSSVSGSGASNLTVVAADNANSSTPAATATTDPGSQATASLTVNGALALSPPGSLAAAVNGRSFGTGSACGVGGATTCQPAQFAVSGGLGGYTTSPVPSAAPGTWTCPLVGSNYNCSTSSVSATGTFPLMANLSLSISDAANASTPAGTSGTVTASLTVDGALALALNPDPAANPAVQNRDYGVTADSGCLSGACQAPTFTPSGGLGNYNITAPSSGTLPAGITCPVANQNTASATASCSGSPTGTSSSFSVSVIDIANASTPAAGTATVVSTSITVDSPLAITTPTALPNGLVGSQYPNPAIPGTPTTLSVSGGLGSSGTYTWIAPGGTGCPSGTSLPAGISLNAVSGVLSGTPTTASANPTTTFPACVTDPPNATTPAGSATTSGLTINVIGQLAYIAEPGIPQVEVVNTFSNATVTQIPMPASSNPTHLAISPSGRFVYVTLAGTNQLAIVDTITNTQITSPATSPISLSSLPGACTDPLGVEATTTQIYIACNGSNTVEVLDASTYGEVTHISTGASTSPEGVAIRADGQRVYVTLSNASANSLFVINTQTQTGSAFTLGPDGNSPTGIALVPNGGSTYAYIAKQAGSDANGGVDVVDVTSDTLSIVHSFSLTAGPPQPNPDFVTATPDNSRVYVSLQGTDQAEVFNPSSPTSSPTTLSLTSGAIPQGIAIPPQSSVPTSGFLVYVSQQGLDSLGLIDDNAGSPAVDTTTTPPTLTASSGPIDIASIPPPQ